MTVGAKTIVVSSASGGAGATTVALNLAAALPQHAAGRVLLIDGHYPVPGDLAAFAGVERAKSVGEIVPIMPRLTSDLFASYLTPGPGQLTVLPLVSDVFQARHVTADLVKRVFELSRRAFAAIVVDEGWASGVLTPTLYEHADVVCLVAEPTAQSLQRARGVLEYFRALHV